MTSANSVNVGRLLPQMIYYFHAMAQLAREDGTGELERRAWSELMRITAAFIKAHPIPVPAAPPYPNKSLKAAVQAGGTKAAGAPKR